MNALDRIDYEIVRLLRKNARISNKELAGLVGLAPSTCLVRTRLLQQAGVITGFKAEVNPAKLGVGLQAMISVRLKRHYKPDVEAFRQHALAARPVPFDELRETGRKIGVAARGFALLARRAPAPRRFDDRDERAHE